MEEEEERGREREGDASAGDNNSDEDDGNTTTHLRFNQFSHSVLIHQNKTKKETNGRLTKG